MQSTNKKGSIDQTEHKCSASGEKKDEGQKSDAAVGPGQIAEKLLIAPISQKVNEREREFYNENQHGGRRSTETALRRLIAQMEIGRKLRRDWIFDQKVSTLHFKSAFQFLKIYVFGDILFGGHSRIAEREFLTFLCKRTSIFFFSKLFKNHRPHGVKKGLIRAENGQDAKF